MSSKISSVNSGANSNGINRFDIKNYYRKSSGFMSFMNGIFMLAVVAIGFYIAENFTVIANSSADSDNGIASLYYVVVFFGLFVSVSGIIFGVAGIRGESDGNFKSQRVAVVLSAALYALYIIGAIMSFTGEEYKIDDAEYIAYYMIGVGVAVIGIVYDVLVFIMTTKALRYCDGKKGEVANVPAGIDKDLLDKRYISVMLSGHGIISLSIWLLCWYFERQIVKFETNFATDCGADAMIFMVIKYLGILGVVYTAVCIYMNFKNKKAAEVMTKQSLFYSGVVLVMALIFCILTTGKAYVNAGYPALEYYTFTYVLGIFATLIGSTTYNRIRMQKMKG